MLEDLNTMTPEEWLKNNYKFKVPVYQRLFTWDTTQFERLLSDLQDWRDNKGTQEPYYLGIITVVEQDDKLILIDGQQRLTVITILMGLFKCFLKTDLDNNKNINDYLDYEARPCDRKALETIWEKGSVWLDECKNEYDLNKVMDENQIVSDSMRLFIKHIYKEKNKWGNVIKDNDETKNLFSLLTLLVSKLPKSYEESLEKQNEYFEKMNSAGKQLEPHEILKVRICKDEKDFRNWNNVEDFTSQFVEQNEGATSSKYSISGILEGTRIDEKRIRIGERTISFLDEKIWTSIEKWRPSLVSFPMFLLHVLKVIDIGFCIPRDSHTLLKCFEKRNTSGFVSSMCEYRIFLDKWIIHKDIDAVQIAEEEDLSKDISDFSYWNNKNQVKTVEVSADIKEATSRNLKQIQMALYALGGQKQEWIVFAFRAYKKSQKILEYTHHNIAEFLLAYLVRYLIRKADFEKSILLGDEWPDKYLTYNSNNHAQFICLDYFLWLLANSSDKDKGLREEVFDGINKLESIKKFVPRPHKSVEHFHPQTDTYSKPEIVAAWKDKKDMFGNLALISSGRNSEYSNYSVEEKTARINRLENNDNELESIKLYLMKEACGGKDIEWNPQRAHDHAQEMLKVLKWGIKHYWLKYFDEHLLESNISKTSADLRI